MKIDCVFIHGWAMNSSVWQQCLQQLPHWINPVCVDLPGHGESADVDATTLDDYVEHVAQRITRPAILVGWSLGGLVSLQLARRYPQKVTALFQVATNPRFVRAVDWKAAIDASVFEQFAASLESDMSKTIRRFLALQVRGTNVSMQTVRQLQRAIDECGLPRKAALLSGLKILSDTDLTAAVENLDCAVSWLLGEKDALVPVELAAALKSMSTRVDIRIISGAGHAPFISHPIDFVNALLNAADGVR